MTLNFELWSGVTRVMVDSALRAVVLAAAAGIALAAFRVKATWLRLSTWKGVLGAALAMPLLACLVPVVSIPVPSIMQQRIAASPSIHTVLFQSADSTAAVGSGAGQVRIENIDRTRRIPASSNSSPTVMDSSDVASWISTNWVAAANAIYFAIVILLLVRLAAGFVLGRRLIRRSQRVVDSRISQSIASHAGSQRVRVYESQVVSVPVTMGAMHPAIVLPADWREWSEAKIDAVIAHEFSHVVRRDALTQMLSRIHCAVFWFSPLAWWLDRQVNILAEQASDEAALSSGADRTEYAKALLGFFENLQAAPGRVWWQGVSMAKAGQAEHRLEKILSWRGVVHMGVKRSVLVAFVALAVPSVYLIAAAHPANYKVVAPQTSESLPTPAPAVAGTPAPSVLAPVAPAARAGAVVAATPLPAAPGSPAIPPAPVMAWGSGQSHSYGVHHGSYSYGYDDEQRFVIVSGNSDSMTMSGTGDDARHVERLKKQISGDFIWFQRDEKSYIIRDKATVDRARSFWAPQEELGKKQEELGKQQEELGRQQEELGSKMEQVKVHVPDMTAQLDALKAKLQKLGPEATMEQIGDLQSEIGELQSRLGEIQGEAGEQQGKFGKLQGELGEKQGKLGEQQGKLGEQQAELAEKATKQMKSLLDEAIKNGKAQPEPENGGGASI